MKAIFKPCVLKGDISAPPSKSMAHRYLIGAALSGHKCVLSKVDFSEDILATIDCLKALGCDIEVDNDKVVVDPKEFMTKKNSVLPCRESGSTLRFFIPLALCTGATTLFKGSERLFQRPLDVYEKLCEENGFTFKKKENSLEVCGKLEKRIYKVQGDISSQFITGLIFALVYLNEDSVIEIIKPFESRSYVALTISALKAFGVDIDFEEEYKIKIKKSSKRSFSGSIEGDYSNAAFFEGFNCLGSDINISNLDKDSLQGDRVAKEYLEKISKEVPTLDISDCPDLAPVLIAVASLKSGAKFTGTNRLASKESDRGRAMDEELKKIGGGLVFEENSITVPANTLSYKGERLFGHNDHRIVMALSVVLSVTGGEIEGVEAVRKSYPRFFEDIKKLGAEVTLV